MSEPTEIDPRLRAALERDRITVAELARLVGVSPKTINRWDESYKDLCDFIEGRSRAVRVEGGPIGEPAFEGWVLERLGDDGVPRAEVARFGWDVDQWQGVIDDFCHDMKHVMGELRDRASRLTGIPNDPSPSSVIRTPLSSGVEMVPPDRNAERNAKALTDVPDAATLQSMINTHTLQMVSREAELSARGARRNRSLRLTEEEEQRIHAAAARHGMTLSEFLRTLGWMFSG